MADAATIEIPEFSDVDIAFPTKTCLPPYDEVPDDFKGFRGRGDAKPFVEAVSSLFFNGGKLADFGLTFKPGVDQTKAGRALRVCLGSWEPKHEHKIAGAAYLLSQWCDYRPAKKSAA